MNGLSESGSENGSLTENDQYLNKLSEFDLGDPLKYDSRSIGTYLKQTKINSLSRAHPLVIRLFTPNDPSTVSIHYNYIPYD